MKEKEAAVISELRRQVNGKEGKFIKVSGDSRRQCSSGKKHKNDKSFFCGHHLKTKININV